MKSKITELYREIDRINKAFEDIEPQLIEEANGNRDILCFVKELIGYCKRCISIEKDTNSILQCPECKTGFRFIDTDIIEDTWVICPTCKNKINIAEMREKAKQTVEAIFSNSKKLIINTMTTQEQIAVMQAFVEGKEIECYSGTSLKWDSVAKPTWNWRDCQYRIKPEPPKPILRPFYTIEEVMQAMKEHGEWTRSIEGNYPHYRRIFMLDTGRDGIKIDGCNPIALLHRYTFLDGTPFGVEEGVEE